MFFSLAFCVLSRFTRCLVSHVKRYIPLSFVHRDEQRCINPDRAWVTAPLDFPVTPDGKALSLLCTIASKGVRRLPCPLLARCLLLVATIRIARTRWRGSRAAFTSASNGCNHATKYHSAHDNASDNTSDKATLLLLRRLYRLLWWHLRVSWWWIART